MKKTLSSLISALFISITTFISVFAQTETPVKFVSAPKFVISEEDKQAGVGGSIKVAVTVKEDGTVKDTNVYVAPAYPCEGNFASRIDRIMKEAEKWVRNFKFVPATKDGKPFESRVGITLDLDENPLSNDRLPIGQKSPASIKAGVVNGKATKLEKPRYPATARSEGAAGAVSVQVLIDEEGKVVRAQAISGHPLLHFASREAACSSQFSPTTLKGDRVKVSGVITYNFVPR